MSGYKCFYNGKTCEVYADTSYGAQCRAQVVFKVTDKKRYLISVFRCVDADGNPITHSTAGV